MGDIFTHLRRGKTSGYIFEDIKHPCTIGRRKKKFCKNAIVWLLSKTPHSIWEIADHFEISPQLVISLISKLIRSGQVVKLADSDRYQARLEG